MKDLVAKLLAAIPTYVRLLIELLSGPRRFIVKQDLGTAAAVKKALTFLAISFGLAFIAQLPLLPEKQDKELLFGALAVQTALGFALNLGILTLAWRAVGGKLAWKKLVAATCYFSGVSTLLFLAVFLLAAGTFNVLDSIHYRQMLSGGGLDPTELANSSGFEAFLIILGAGLLAVFGWIFWIWGGYRELNQVSRLRSGIALAVFVVLSPLVLLVQLLIGASLSRGARTALPAELVGKWQMQHAASAGGVASGELLTYQFSPEGSYSMVDIKGSGSPGSRCMKTVTESEFGQVSAQGSTLALAPRMRTESTSDDCSGKRSEAPMSPQRELYHFVIHQRPTGWELCLNGRFGEVCLTPAKE